MKRTHESGFGSARSAFQRVTAADSTPPPQTGNAPPVLHQNRPRLAMPPYLPPQRLPLQPPPPPPLPLPRPPPAARLASGWHRSRPEGDDAELIASAGEVLRLTIRSRRPLQAQLACPFAADAAKAVDRDGHDAFWHAIQCGNADAAHGLLALLASETRALLGGTRDGMPPAPATARNPAQDVGRLPGHGPASTPADQVRSGL